MYYADGQEFGRHDARHLPERPMSINFKRWLIDLAGQTSTTARSYDQEVDYVLHVKDQVLTPAQVAAKVVAYRTAGTVFEDSVPAVQRLFRSGSGQACPARLPGTGSSRA